MATTRSAEASDLHVDPVGPFTGFGNFFRKEVTDWWKSTRLIVIFVIPTLIMLAIVFATNKMDFQEDESSKQLVATRMLVVLFSSEAAGPALYIIMIIFSTMGILTTEKSTGTLAWNLTKPLGRTGLFVAKWLSATLLFWLAACVIPVLLASVCMIAYHGITPHFDKMAPIVGVAFAWIGLWVLLSLTVSLGFQSQAAVGGIVIAFWIVPFLLVGLLGLVLGVDTAKWIVDRIATNSPFWAFDVVADKTLQRGRAEWKNIYLYAFAGWMIVLSVFSLWTFNRQEIGS